MCGIVGYVGNKSVVDILLDGLEQLEYRGYDSSGIAVMCENEIKVYKAIGKLQNLRDELKGHENEYSASTMGIGHIRWATHGAPTLLNAHPHTCTCGNLVVVHNGIIENYKELRDELSKDGCVFRSQTDTEAVAHLVARKYAECKDLTEAVRLASEEIEGAYALCVMHHDCKNTLVITKRNAPLLIGIGDGEYYAASDVPAIIKHTNKAVYLEDNQIATLTPESMQMIDADGNKLSPKIEVLPWEPVALSKMGYKHFMLKEIHEQPDVIRNILVGRLHAPDESIILNEVKLTKETLKNLDRIQIIACGTSLHAAMIGKYLIESFCGIAVDVEASSEYIYRKTVTNERTLVIGVSQSGETADTLTAIKQAKAKGSHILIITNRPDSAMAREADSLIPVNAGIEVSVAATKSYIAQLMAFYLLSLYMAEIKDSIAASTLTSLKAELMILPQKIEQILAHKENIQTVAKAYANTKDFIYIARGINFATSLEGALKLKEISYINATGYPAGELKHGTISLITDGMPVIAVATQSHLLEKTVSNIVEVKSRGAMTITVCKEGEQFAEGVNDYIVEVPELEDVLMPMVTVIPLQMIAYYTSVLKGLNVDKPRNLAKSVTVE